MIWEGTLSELIYMVRNKPRFKRISPTAQATPVPNNVDSGSCIWQYSLAGVASAPQPLHQIAIRQPSWPSSGVLAER